MFSFGDFRTEWRSGFQDIFGFAAIAAKDKLKII